MARNPRHSNWKSLSILAPVLTSPIPTPTRINCIATSTTLTALIRCFNKHTVPQDTYDAMSYAAAQPSPAERTAWSDAVASLLAVDSVCSCVSLVVPSAISDFYRIDLFTEWRDTGLGVWRNYCVLSEKTVSAGGYYTKGWGLVVVPGMRRRGRGGPVSDLHISAPHPIADMYTPRQAAEVFGLVYAKSLIIAGRHRRAYDFPTECMEGVEGGDEGDYYYYKTDPVHDDTQPFFDAVQATWKWQNDHGGCSPTSCAYLQFHGKGPHKCARDDVFLSTGLGTGAWYTSPTGRPIRHLKRRLQTAFPSWTIALPPDDAECDLTATKNIFGRLINGVPPEEVCTTGAKASDAHGQFVHIEQAPNARALTACGGWKNALEGTFLRL